MHFPPYATILVATISVVDVAASPRPASPTTGYTIPIFKHARFLNPNKSVDLDTFRSHVAFVHSKIFLGFNNYETNAVSGQKFPFPTVVQKRQDGVPLVGSAGQPWSVMITLGTSGYRSKMYHVSLDTASADTFLPDVKCDSTCDGHQLWDSRQTKNAYNMRGECLISYSDGSEVSGKLYMVSVFFTATRFNTPPQPICAARNYPQAYQSPGFVPDGVMGMAFSSISSYGAKTVFQNLVDHGQVAVPVFSFQFLDTGGELYLGGVNTELFSGRFTYIPVKHPGFWLVEMDAIQVYDLLPVEGGLAIIDTSSIFITGPSSQVRQLQRTLGGALAPSLGEGIYVFPCIHTPPDIMLSFGGTSFLLPGKSLNLGEVTAGSGNCMSAIVANDIIYGVNLWVVGIPFLQHVYSTFDARGDHPQVGFATLVSQF